MSQIIIGRVLLMFLMTTCVYTDIIMNTCDNIARAVNMKDKPSDKCTTRACVGAKGFKKNKPSDECTTLACVFANGFKKHIS